MTINIKKIIQPIEIEIEIEVEITVANWSEAKNIAVVPSLYAVTRAETGDIHYLSIETVKEKIIDNERPYSYYLCKRINNELISVKLD